MGHDQLAQSQVPLFGTLVLSVQSLEAYVLLSGCQLTPLTSPGRDGAVKISGAIVVSTDVTDLTGAQEGLQQSYIESGRLRASEEAAIEASRLKSEFVANISAFFVSGRLASLLKEEGNGRP